MSRETTVGEKKSRKRRIVVVDNQPLLRRGLSELINTEPDLEVCAQSGTPRGALEAINVTRADLVITSLSISDGIGDGLALIADIRSQHADLPVLVLSMHDGSRWAERAIKAGANSFVSKQEIADTLLDAVHALLDEKEKGFGSN